MRVYRVFFRKFKQSRKLYQEHIHAKDQQTAEAIIAARDQHHKVIAVFPVPPERS